MVWMKEKEPPVDNSNLEPRINTVESKVNDFTRNANRQTAPLGPGYNVINTDQSTPVDFEIEGRTLVNLMGREGGFEYGNPFTGGGGVVVDDEAFSGKYSFRNSYTWSGLNLTDDLNIEKDNYVFIGAMVKTNGEEQEPRITSSGNNRYGEISDEWHFMYNCYYYTGDHSGQTWFLHGQSESGTHSWFDDVRIFVISEAEYNAINEGEWSNSEIERRFPYVDSVQHVLNSAIEAQGKNLLPPFTQWNLPQAISVDGYEVTMQNDASSATNYVEIDVLPHTTYTLSIEETNADRFGYREVRNADGTDLQSMQTDFIRFENPHTFTTTSQAKRMRFHLYSMEVEEDVYYKNPQLELGSQATPFTPYNPEYLYFHENGEPLKLADGEKVYQDAGRWVKSKKWETDVVLDNSLNWGRMETSSEHQPLLPYPDSYNGGSVLVVKNNGEPLKETRSTSDVNAIFVGSSNLIILLPEEDKEGYDFSTSDEVKRFFDDNPFTMNYKLAEPTTEEISREGAISFHDGKNLVNVIQGVVVREKMGFSEGVNIDWNFKREDDEHDPDTMANYKVDKIIPVYQNESLFTDYETRGEDRSFGKDRVVIRPEHYDQDADFYVTYIALPHENTAALTSVKAHYMTNLKTVVDRLVQRDTEKSTEISIHARQIVELFARVRAGGL